MDCEPHAKDQKGNCYYRCKLISRDFLQEDIMKVMFELPGQTSLKALGIDAGLGDFVRIRPHHEDHQKLVQNPAGGRAYSPITFPHTKGKFGLIVKPYGPGGVSSLLKQIDIGSQMLVTNHVEHVFWEERQRGYYCNERNVDFANGNLKQLSASDMGESISKLDGAQTGQTTSDGCNVCLIAFGIGITEIAPVAMSELQDPGVKSVTILWALRKWRDSEWARKSVEDEDPENMVHQFFAEHRSGKYGDRVAVKHILSQEEREDCLHGRINSDILKKVFLESQVPQESLRFLVAGTTGMIEFAYKALGELGPDRKSVV